ncbi:pimeloyl-ACP methyl ester carboxylesterase [Brevibacterium sanguinis]|uniref:Pimeloyl-ACP methyl ester carboxylesterase n=2 Tax=Brevibacterium TaxID=1696 RepID=A0A366IHX1_9MICO|nr:MULTISPECIES: alpha/beta hydrolase [Brevibacterium]RBP64255.1 pimeloyl-ACP methyl ester carboxylesterase [Brevibacterium sanguinis]RBP71453.1 pimeloyl-ACP methyl ester carboxylesterase [Brevibacterium celere]
MSILEQRLDLPGCSLAFHDSGGAGRAVVFLHGAGADHVTFLHQATALRSAGHRVVLADLRGHGRSHSTTLPPRAELLLDDVAALIAARGLERPVLVGHSLGGNIAQALVRCSPREMSGLFVMGATWNTGPLSRVDRGLLGLAAPGLALIPAARLPRLLANASATTDVAREDARRAFSQVTKAEFLEIWRATVAFVVPDPGYRTPVPLGLLRGERDRTGNIATAMPAWAAHEGVTDIVVAEAGHFVSQDRPDLVTDALLRFLERLD